MTVNDAYQTVSEDHKGAIIINLCSENKMKTSDMEVMRQLLQ